jgi:glycosyltransferase involved in cell wall biosynthesis
VLFVAHNHPAVRPGGAEGYALELYERMRDSDDWEPLFLARTGPPISTVGRYHEGTLFTSVNGDPGQYFFYTDVSDYDWLYGRSPRKETLTRFFADFLLAHRPDVVHFQHTNFLGYDAIRVVRNTLPDVPIVYTLHEYLPICHRNGQLIRTRDNELCVDSSPRRCHECFPEISPQSFFLRKRFAQSHLALVDHFIAPSRFLLERFVDWGIPRSKISFEPYGRLPTQPVAATPYRPRTRFGFFGQFILYKGVTVLLRAFEQLDDELTVTLRLHGANLELQPQEFRDEFARLVAKTRDRVTIVGRYEQHELPKLMEAVDWVVVPSIWWENAPLVIQEAFAHGRPVICSDVGGMAEAVIDGVNGLHFRTGDAASLARTVRRALTTPALWDTLRAGIPPVYAMDEHLSMLRDLYESVLTKRRSTRARARRQKELELVDA